MNRELWENSISTIRNFNQYPCPNCTSGILKWGQMMPRNKKKENPMAFIKTSTHSFAGRLSCSNSSCKKSISIVGNYYKNRRLVDGAFVKYVDYIEPKFFYPNLRMFQLNKLVPINVTEQIDLSFASFFNDLSSSANRLRNSVEFILDEIKAPKSEVILKKSTCPIRDNKCSKYIEEPKKSTIRFKNLHQRIVNYTKKKNYRIGKLLLANKIIGNEGSHIGKIGVNDMLDAYEILEEILDNLFVKHSKRIDKIADEIVDLKKPRSKK